jgi:hypothetical protein
VATNNARFGKTIGTLVTGLGCVAIFVASAAMIAFLELEDTGDPAGAEVACQSKVEQLLAPKNVDFPWTPRPVVAGGAEKGWIVTGIVDTQNVFGAPIRKIYMCDVRFSDGDYIAAASLID